MHKIFTYARPLFGVTFTRTKLSNGLACRLLIRSGLIFRKQTEAAPLESAAMTYGILAALIHPCFDMYKGIFFGCGVAAASKSFLI